jgi:hypothetical protein
VAADAFDAATSWDLAWVEARVLDLQRRAPAARKRVQQVVIIERQKVK